ncbi:MAG TPA: zinc ABC transporter substrate-binding protein [Longimicrobiaceae bacterium]|nr:zinc ABC transporter substrate-binding protein [Longimicrobiaceae bacterium]
MQLRYGRWVRLATVAVLLAGCTPPPPEDIGNRIRVVTTIGMIGDVVEHVGGDRVSVETLMGPGIDPHLYRASEGDVRRLFGADVIFFSGLHLEAKMGEVLDHMTGEMVTVAVTDAIPRAALLAPPEFAGAHDPHVWFDVEMWAQTLDLVSETLSELEPENAAYFRQNAEEYRAELAELDAYVEQQVARVPPNLRVLVTAHDAFNYFGEAYGFEVIGLQGISTATEAGTADVQRLAELLAKRRIPAIFIETSVPRRTVEAVQAAVQARGFDVKIGGSLFSDAMGNPGTPEGTYIGMVKHNVDTIVDALTRSESK